MRSSLVLLIAPLALAAAPGARSDLPRLVATVGPGFTIDLADARGAHVDVVTAGRYEVLVHDLSAEHNFAFGSKTGTALLVDSGVEFVGDKTFTVDLPRGFYAYACSPHWQIMNGRLTVVAPEAATKALSATVGPRSVTLSATRIAAGKYRLVVADRSRTRNFHLLGPGVNRSTGKAFSGSVTWTLQLGAGTYRFGSDPRLTGRLVVR